MKFGTLTEYKMRNIFLQKSFRKWGWETSSRSLFFKKKALYEVKSPYFQDILVVLDLGKWKKTNCMKFQIVNPEISLILIFLKKCLGLVSPTHFVYDFLGKIFLMWYSINRTTYKNQRTEITLRKNNFLEIFQKF